MGSFREGVRGSSLNRSSGFILGRFRMALEIM